jgi:hypothetical protein
MDRRTLPLLPLRRRAVSVEVAPEVFALIDGRSNEHVIITGSSDMRAAGIALSRASCRFGMVTEDGRELSDEEAEALDEAMEATGEDGPYTPNYVSDVIFASRGPWCSVDCKGYIEPAMRERMIAIMVEELEQAGVSGHIEVPSPGELNYGGPGLLDPWRRTKPGM